MTTTEERLVTTVLMPPKLKERYRHRARQDKRSLTRTLQHALEEWLDTQEELERQNKYEAGIVHFSPLYD
jgi:hypothetical protein